MHIAEGVAPWPLAVGGTFIAVAGVAYGLKTMRDEQIPRTALVASAMFASSLLVRLPLGPSYVHPTLNGLAGLLLGWAALPALTVSLFLQALLFQFGGLTSLGLNTVVMGGPAIVCHALFRRALSRVSASAHMPADSESTGHGAEARSQAAHAHGHRGFVKRHRLFLIGTAVGITASLLSFGLWSTALVLCGSQLRALVALSLLPHLVISAIEGIFTGFVVEFLHKVFPHAFSALEAS